MSPRVKEENLVAIFFDTYGLNRQITYTLSECCQDEASSPNSLYSSLPVNWISALGESRPGQGVIKDTRACSGGFAPLRPARPRSRHISKHLFQAFTLKTTFCAHWLYCSRRYYLPTAPRVHGRYALRSALYVSTLALMTWPSCWGQVEGQFLMLGLVLILGPDPFALAKHLGPMLDSASGFPPGRRRAIVRGCRRTRGKPMGSICLSRIDQNQVQPRHSRASDVLRVFVRQAHKALFLLLFKDTHSPWVKVLLHVTFE